MRKRSIVLLAGAAAIAATLVVGPTATASSDRASAGTVVFIHDQEPPNLQGPWVGNNLYATSLVLNNIWYGGQIRDDKATRSEAVHVKPKLTKKNPLTIPLEFRRTPAGRTASPSRPTDLQGDLAGLHQPGEQRHQPDGLGGRQVRSLPRARRAIVVFKKQYADWEALLSSGVYPAHIIRART